MSHLIDWECEYHSLKRKHDRVMGGVQFVWYGACGVVAYFLFFA